MANQNFISAGRFGAGEACANIDVLYGPYSASGGQTALQVAEAEILRVYEQKVKGLTVGIVQNDGSVKEYWYQPDGQEGLQLVEKQVAAQEETDPTVPAWAKAETKPSYTASEVGAIPDGDKGVANGVATLDNDGKVPQSQLPSYVDDVLEYSNQSSFPATGESGKIYVALDTNKTYRWGGSAYVEISQSLALGETSSTAFAGDRGKAIEDKIPSGASSSNKMVTTSDLNGKVDKVSGATPNNFASFDANGGIKDSGYNDGSFATAAQGAKADSSVQNITRGGVTLAKEDGVVEIPEEIEEVVATPVAPGGSPQATLSNGTLTLGLVSGSDGHNPNLGTFVTSDSGVTFTPALPSAPSVASDYIVVVDKTDPNNVTSTIWTWDTTLATPAWASTGRDANMAYFGSGELLSDVNIVNNLYDGGGENVFSAEQGKKIGDILFKGIPLDLSLIPTHGFYLGADGNYHTDANAKIKFVAVQQGGTYRITTGVIGTSYALITNDNVSANNKAIPCCTEYPNRINQYAGTTEEYVIPSDCYYIVVSSVNTSGTDIEPTIKKIEKDVVSKDELESFEADVLENLFTETTLDLSSIQTFGYYLSAYDAYRTDANAKIKFVAVQQGKTYRITTGAIGTSYALIINDTYLSDNKAIPCCTEYPNRINQYAGTTEEYVIPSDCYYIVVSSVNTSGTDIEPTIKKIEKDVVSKDELESFETDILESVSREENVNDIERSTNFGIYINTDGTWIGGYADRGYMIIPLPYGAKEVLVGSNVSTNGAFLNTTSFTPVAGQMAPFVTNGSRFFITSGQSFPIPSDAACLYVYLPNKSSVFDISILVKNQTEEVVFGNEIDNVEFNDSPITIWSTADTGLPSSENKSFTWPCVVKVSPSLYYMYYNTIGTNDSIGDQHFHLSFAYSTDGFAWTKGIPSGINPPISGTNKLFESGVFGVCVVKVPDNDYPFRMFGSKWHESWSMYKSADGVNWTEIRKYNYYYDTQMSAIVRGSQIKVYMRMRNGTGRLDRYVGVMTTDLEGNLIAPPTIFFGKYLYNAAASPLDDRREILFPSFYNVDADEMYLKCYVVDGKNIYPRDVDFSNIITSSDKTMYVAPNLVNIGDDYYIYYFVTNQPHNSSNTRIATMKMAKVTFNAVGWYWYPQ